MKTKQNRMTDEQYSELCDLMERVASTMPVDPDEEPLFMMTSPYARDAVRRIVEILGLEP